MFYDFLRLLFLDGLYKNVYNSIMRVIAGEKKHLLLKTLDDLSIRPTTDKIKETLFNIIQFDLQGENFLDLFAGSGAIGIEALSRGCKLATFVDNNREAINVINTNLNWTKLIDKSNVYQKDVITFIENNADKNVYHIVFIDPPYEKDLYKETLSKLTKSSLIDNNSIIITESNINEDFGFVKKYDLEIMRVKEYKNNKHTFLKKV